MSRQSSPKVTVPLGYEVQFWQMADALRKTRDATEFKHVVLGLIFLKYISDVFVEQHAKLVAGFQKLRSSLRANECQFQSGSANS